MKKNKISKNWINKQRRDIFVRKSKVEGYRSRAVYKLQEIDEKYNILKNGITLIDLGAGTNKAAEVESFFDDLTDFDEKAEATAAGKITETLVNIGIPGGVAFKAGIL